MDKVYCCGISLHHFTVSSVEQSTQATVLHKVKSDPKLKEFLDKKEKQL